MVRVSALTYACPLRVCLFVFLQLLVSAQLLSYVNLLFVCVVLSLDKGWGIKNLTKTVENGNK